MAKSIPECWICGEDAITREHKTKKSNLNSVFGVPTQTQPLFYHHATRIRLPDQLASCALACCSWRPFYGVCGRALAAL
jgi:hypothetical protein